MILFAPVGAAIVVLVLWDAFETMVLPRRVDRRVRIARVFYRVTWSAWKRLVTLAGESRSETILGVFGPLSVILLFAFWFGALIFGFGLLLYALDSKLVVDGHGVSFGTTIYMSGTNFFTLGIGDVSPNSAAGRTITVVEGGTGFGFLALVIGYLPVLYQSFSRREVSISLLDARAGSPPSAGEMLRRHAHGGQPEDLDRLLLDWERWSADLLESHLSYPVLAYFRSQHDRQSWLGALTAILDFCALLMVCGDERLRHRAELAFAMSRHAVVDLAQIFGRELHDPDGERLSPAEAALLEPALAAAGLAPLSEDRRLHQLAQLRRLYEPYAEPLAGLFLTPLPPFFFAVEPVDDWRTSDRESVIG